ncbi:MAG: hypothetical protein ACXACU_04470 [Candidatus Hodarchaeales archaeon]
MSSNTSSETKKEKRFYLVTTDFLQGIGLILMIIGHAGHWWDHDLARSWPHLEFWSNSIIWWGFLVFPMFLFVYGFNTTNSLLKRDSLDAQNQQSIRLIKRSIIFVVFSMVSQLLLGAISGEWLEWLLTWHLFHMFALSTLVIVLFFKIIWRFEKAKGFQLLSAFFLLSLIFVLVLFLILHDYSVSENLYDPVSLNLENILRHIFLDLGSCPILPWLSYSLAGGLMASFLKLSTSPKNEIIRKSKFVYFAGMIFVLIGIVFEISKIEIWISAPVLKPASTSFIFGSIGLLTIGILTMIFSLDFKHEMAPRRINKFVLPVVLLGNISLTVFITHNIYYIIDPAIVDALANLLSVSGEFSTILFGLFFSAISMIITMVWANWKFKYSFEWIMINGQKAQWRWWNRN